MNRVPERMCAINDNQSQTRRTSGLKDQAQWSIFCYASAMWPSTHTRFSSEKEFPCSSPFSIHPNSSPSDQTSITSPAMSASRQHWTLRDFPEPFLQQKFSLDPLIKSLEPQINFPIYYRSDYSRIIADNLLTDIIVLSARSLSAAAGGGGHDEWNTIPHDGSSSESWRWSRQALWEYNDGKESRTMAGTPEPTTATNHQVKMP